MSGNESLQMTFSLNPDQPEFGETEKNADLTLTKTAPASPSASTVPANIPIRTGEAQSVAHCPATQPVAAHSRGSQLQVALPVVTRPLVNPNNSGLPTFSVPAITRRPVIKPVLRHARKPAGARSSSSGLIRTRAPLKSIVEDDRESGCIGAEVKNKNKGKVRAAGAIKIGDNNSDCGDGIIEKLNPSERLAHLRRDSQVLKEPPRPAIEPQWDATDGAHAAAEDFKLPNPDGTTIYSPALNLTPHEQSESLGAHKAGHLRPQADSFVHAGPSSNLGTFVVNHIQSQDQLSGQAGSSDNCFSQGDESFQHNECNLTYSNNFGISVNDFNYQQGQHLAQPTLRGNLSDPTGNFPIASGNYSTPASSQLEGSSAPTGSFGSFGSIDSNGFLPYDQTLTYYLRHGSVADFSRVPRAPEFRAHPPTVPSSFTLGAQEHTRPPFASLLYSGNLPQGFWNWADIPIEQRAGFDGQLQAPTQFNRQTQAAPVQNGMMTATHPATVTAQASTGPSQGALTYGTRLPRQPNTAKAPAGAQKFWFLKQIPLMPSNGVDPLVDRFCQPPGPSAQDLINRMPFVNEAIAHEPDMRRHIIRITEFPYECKINAIVAALGKSARIAPMFPGTTFPAIHIMTDRSSGMTRDCYVEFETEEDALFTMNHWQERLKNGNRVRVGTRDIQLDHVDQSSFFAALFPRAACTWNGPVPTTARKMGLLLPEELHMTRTNVEGTQRNRYIPAHSDRMYNAVISMIAKYPWFAIDHYTVTERDDIFETVRFTIKNLALKLHGDKFDPLHGKHLLQQLVHAALTCPAFNEKQRMIIDSMHYGLVESSVFISHWAREWPFRVLTRPLDASNDLVQYYAVLMSINLGPPRVKRLGAFGAFADGLANASGRTMASVALEEREYVTWHLETIFTRGLFQRLIGHYRGY